MENKIWYLFPNERNYLEIPGILYIQANTFCSLENTIQASIDSFNRNVVWNDMWDINEAKSRLEKGNILFIGLDHEGTLAHVWFEDNYLYNLYVDPRRPEGYGESFIKGCLNFIPFHTISLYVDEWNIKAQKFFEKVGAHKISSYI
jgi:hypothetical protein